MDYNSQTHHLAKKCVQLDDVKRRYTEEAVSRRQCSFKYYFPTGNTHRIQVCQKVLCQIYKITPRRLQKLQEKLKFDKPLADLRGKHSNRPNRINDSVKNAIRVHIEKLPKQESHYSRHRSEKLCLSPDLNIKKLFNLFVKENPNIDCTLRAYTDVFRGEFNIRFGLPRSDSCGYCDRLYMQLVACNNDDDRKKLQNESMKHHMSADAAYKTLKADTEKAKINKDYIVICTDLQQVLYCPTVSHSAVFYQRQFSTYNQAVHNVGSNKVFMFVWPENVAKRGSGEIYILFIKICYL